MSTTMKGNGKKGLSTNDPGNGLDPPAARVAVLKFKANQANSDTDLNEQELEDIDYDPPVVKYVSEVKSLNTDITHNGRIETNDNLSRIRYRVAVIRAFGPKPIFLTRFDFGTMQNPPRRRIDNDH